MNARPLRPRQRAVLGLLLALSAAPTLLGAEAPPEKPGRFHVGPFWLTPRLELRGAGKDTNVYNSQFDAISDAAAVLSPSLGVAVPVGQRFRFSGRGFLNFNWFDGQSSERSTDRGFSVRGEADLRRLTFFGETGRGWFKRRFTIDLDERLPYREHSASVGVKARVSRRFTLTGALDTGRFEIEDSAEQPGVASTLNRDTSAYRFEARYALTRRTGLVASAESLSDRFDDALGAASNEVDSGRYLGGFEFASRALSGRLLAGVRDFPAASGSAAPSYTGPAVEATLQFPLGSRARLVLDAEREVYYAARPTASSSASELRNSYVSWRSRGELALELPWDLLLRGLLGYEDASYVLSYQDPDVRNDASHRWTYGGALLRVLGDHLRLGGGVTWERRSGDTVTGPYRGARWGLQAEFVP